MLRPILDRKLLINSRKSGIDSRPPLWSPQTPAEDEVRRTYWLPFLAAPLQVGPRDYGLSCVLSTSLYLFWVFDGSVVAVAAERPQPHGFEMGVVTIKIRCATPREVRLHRLERTH